MEAEATMALSHSYSYMSMMLGASSIDQLLRIESKLKCDYLIFAHIELMRDFVYHRNSQCFFFVPRNVFGQHTESMRNKLGFYG